MARLMIGLPGLVGKVQNYARKHDLVELRPVDTPLPKPSKLAQWRRKVPPTFAFSVVLPRVVAALESGAAHDQALAASLAAATALQASCIVLSTPPAVRPTKRNRERIAALARRLPATGLVLAWHAAGLWEPIDVMATASNAGLLPIFDVAQEPLPPGPVAYTRVRALGLASKLGADRIARMVEQLAGRREAYVVADPEIVGRVRAGLKAMMGLADDGSFETVRPVPALFRSPKPLVFSPHSGEE